MNDTPENDLDDEEKLAEREDDEATGLAPSKDADLPREKVVESDPKPERVETWWEMFRTVYLTIDRRTLGLTRICLGFYLIFDLLRRTGDWLNMFGDKGVLPTELILTHPQANGFSLLHGFVSPWELWILWGVIMATFICVFIGYKTKVAQVLSLLFVTSMNGRVLLIENGGYVVQNLLLLWTCFMPLGDRFSLDAMLASWKRKREKTADELNDRTDMLEPWRQKPFASFVALVLLIQLSAVYYFNKLHKTGPAWSFKKAEAVHYVMYVDRMVNPIIADVRTHIPFFVYQMMTRSVLFSEMFLAFFFLVSVLPGKFASYRRTAADWIMWAFGSLFFVWVMLHCPTDVGEMVQTARRFQSEWFYFLIPLAFFLPDAVAVCRRVLPAGAREVFDLFIGVLTAPFQKIWGRRIALVIVNFLHIGFGSTFVLGPFAWALCVFSTLLFQTEDWDTTNVAMRREKRARTVLYDPTSGAAFWFCRIVKRLDLFDLLAFDVADETERKAGIVVERLDGSRNQESAQPGYRETANPEGRAIPATQVTGAVAFAEIFAAFPVGSAFAWIFKLPIISSLINSMMARGRWSKLFRLKIDSKLPEKDPTAAPIYSVLKWTKGSFREAFIFVMFLACINQALTELWVTKTRWSEWIAEENKSKFIAEPVDFKVPSFFPWTRETEKGSVWRLKGSWTLSTQPEMSAVLIHKLRFLQGWFMFSPNPVMDDGTILVDAVTVDGRHVDPFWNTPPTPNLHDVQSFRYNQIWSDYFNRIHIAGNRQYRDAMVDYMRLLPQRTGNPNDKLVSGEVYWIHDMNPRWGTTDSYGEGRDLMFTFDKEGGAHDPPATPAKKPDGT